MFKYKYTDEELINYLHKFKDEYGRVPSTTDIDRTEGYPRGSIYSVRFGSYKTALKIAGLERSQLKNNKYDDEHMLECYKQVYNFYGKQPTLEEYDKYRGENNNFPSSNALVKRFGNFEEVNKKLGLKTQKSKYGGLDREFLILELKRFNDEFGRPPQSAELDGSNKDYPSRKTYTKYFGSLGNALVEAGFEYRGIESGNRKKPLPKGIKQFTKEDLRKYIDEYISVHGEVPALKEITEIPEYPTRQDFRRLFGGYNNALIEFGYKPKHIRSYSDDDLKNAFFSFVEKNGRIPIYMEFNNSEYPSFWCYQNRFGSWNKAVEAYGFEPYDHKSLEELQDDILKLCQHIENTENRRIITCADIDNCEECSTSGTYHKNFRKHLNMTLGEYIRSIGYDMPKLGLGMVYEFEDGEITVSKYEFEVSCYFRDMSILYERNIKYKQFIRGYSGNKNCDYVVKINNKIWYIEVAGMLDYEKGNLESSITKDYKNKLNDKIHMLQKENLNYKIVYPSDFREKTLDEVFSFLNK